MYSYSGWFSFVILPAGYVKMFAFVLIGYLIVMVFDFMRIRKIPMDQALKMSSDIRPGKREGYLLHSFRNSSIIKG